MLVRSADGKYWGGQAGCDGCEEHRQAGHFVCSPWGVEDGAEVLFRAYSDCQREVCSLAADILNDEGGDWRLALHIAEEEFFFQPIAQGRPAPCHCSRLAETPNREGRQRRSSIINELSPLQWWTWAGFVAGWLWGIALKGGYASAFWTVIGGVALGGTLLLLAGRFGERPKCRKRDPLLEALKD
jgi:hypothetical protein